MLGYMTPGWGNRLGGDHRQDACATWEHRQDACATETTGKMPVPPFTIFLQARCLCHFAREEKGWDDEEQYRQNEESPAY